MSSHARIFVDLTHSLDMHVPTYPGDPPFNASEVLSIPKDGYSIHMISMGSQTGTHIDAPSHFIENGKTVDQIPLSDLVGPALAVDLVQKSLPPRTKITWDLLEPYEPQMREGVILLIATGWSKWHWGKPTYYDHPYLAKDTAQRILAKGIKVIGMDVLSPDETPMNDVGGAEGYGFHEVFLGAGGYIVENLTHLEQILGKENVEVGLLPLNLTGMDGAPIRAYARFPE
ncbi:putative cyclase [Cyathus striatus]|nr:putative cyclase [Cyathus striatus]